MTEEPPSGRRGPGCRPREEMGGRTDVGTEAVAGTRRRVKRLEAEAGRWRVCSTSRWTEFRAGKVCGDRVRQRGATATTAIGGGAVARRRKENDPENF